MSEMIERVAVAIREADILELAKRYPELEVSVIRKQADDCWGDHLSMARAAIEATREPTPEMVAAGLAAVSDATVSEPKATAWDALRFHRAMIDDALAE